MCATCVPAFDMSFLPSLLSSSVTGQSMVSALVSCWGGEQSDNGVYRPAFLLNRMLRGFWRWSCVFQLPTASCRPGEHRCFRLGDPVHFYFV